MLLALNNTVVCYSQTISEHKDVHRTSLTWTAKDKKSKNLFAVLFGCGPFEMWHTFTIIIKGVIAIAPR